ncbi:MAG: OmpA family protein [Pseudomonadota bacterium]
MPLVKIKQAVFIAVVLLTGAAAPEVLADPTANSACYSRAFYVYFDSWRADLSATAATAIETEQHRLTACAIDHVRIVGMAGAPGDEAENQKLSQQRADAVADALAAGGWRRSAFEIIAIGERNAAAGDLSRPMRRRVRVDIEVSPPATQTASH